MKMKITISTKRPISPIHQNNGRSLKKSNISRPPVKRKENADYSNRQRFTLQIGFGRRNVGANARGRTPCCPHHTRRLNAEQLAVWPFFSPFLPRWWAACGGLMTPSELATVTNQRPAAQCWTFKVPA